MFLAHATHIPRSECHETLKTHSCDTHVGYHRAHRCCGHGTEQRRPAVGECWANRSNWSDINTQAEPQECSDHCRSLHGFDVHRLDRDGDGVAGEGLA